MIYHIKGVGVYNHFRCVASVSGGCVLRYPWQQLLKSTDSEEGSPVTMDTSLHGHRGQMPHSQSYSMDPYLEVGISHICLLSVFTPINLIMC